MDRELTTIAERLSAILEAIENYIQAATKERDRKRDRENIPVDIAGNIVGTVGLPEAIETQRNADQERYHTTQKVIAVAAWAAFVAALCYAVIAQLTFNQIKEQTAQLYRQAEIENAGASHRAAETFRQLNIAQAQASAAAAQVTKLQAGVTETTKLAAAATKANEIAQEAMEAQTRPWIGIDGDLVVKNTKFVPANDPTQMQVDFSFTLKNYGQSPGIQVAYSFEVRRGAPIPKKTLFANPDICSGPDSNSKQTNWKTTDSIFPQATVTHDEQVIVYAQFLYGCIAYQRAGKLYHTKFAYQIITEQGFGEHRISPTEMRPFLSPVKSFRLMYTDAE